MARTPAEDDTSLKRLGGGRWQTRDERFTIEPQSGTWVVVDAEQTDDLGLPLVRGPFRSLTDAKVAIGQARIAPAAASPLAVRIGRRVAKSEPSEPSATPGPREDGRPAEALPSTSRRPERAAATKSRRTKRVEEPPAEPRWIAALAPDDRRRARRLVARLETAGAPDPEGMARRDIVGDVAAVASFAIQARLAELGTDADPRTTAAMLAEGRNDDLGVRWRVVDDDGRPIRLEPERSGSTSSRRSR